MKRTLTTPQKLLASVAVVATAGALTAGAFAAWSSNAAQEIEMGSAVVSSTMTSPGGGDWADVELDNMVTGDTVTRYADLANTGTIDQTMTVRVDGTEGGLTASGAGLRVQIKDCAAGWDDGICSGEPTTMFADAFVTDNGIGIEPFVLDAGAVRHMQITFTLPTNTAEAFQGKCDTFHVTEVGVPVSEYAHPV